MKRLALIVPEYRTPQAGGGGLAAVADFVDRALGGAHVPEAERWEVQLVSPRMYHRAPEHRSPLRPRSLLRRPSVGPATAGNGRAVRYVGTTLPEVEQNRYRPRRALTALVDDCDAAIVIAGTPAIGSAMRDVSVPWALKVATLVEEERQARLAATRGARGVLLRRATAATARLDRRALRAAGHVVTVNDSMAERIRTLTSAPVEVLPPGVDTETFHPAPVRAHDGPIIMVSRLNDARKDVPTLLRAYEVARREHGVRNELVLAGRHRLPAADRALIDRLGLASVVRVVESPDDRTLTELLRSAAAFALASREEGLGVVFLEAMASGLPVVTTATRGAVFAVPSDAGRTVAFGATLVADLASALAAVVSDQERADRQGAAARRHVEAHFALPVAEARWRRLADGLVEGSAR